MKGLCDKHGFTSRVDARGIADYAECPICRMEKAELFIEEVRRLVWDRACDKVDNLVVGDDFFHGVSRLLGDYRAGTLKASESEKLSPGVFATDIRAANKLIKMGHPDIVEKVLVGRVYAHGESELFVGIEDEIIAIEGEKIIMTRRMASRRPAEFVQFEMYADGARLDETPTDEG